MEQHYSLSLTNQVEPSRYENIERLQQNATCNADLHQNELQEAQRSFGIHIPHTGQALEESNNFVYPGEWSTVPFASNGNHQLAISPIQEQVQNPHIYGFQENTFAVLQQPFVFRPQQNIINEIDYSDLLEEREPLVQQFPQVDQALEAQVAPAAHINLADAVPGNDGNGLTPKCKHNCGGNFAGLHKCFHHGRSLIILCRGNSDCSSTFRNRNDFNRHCNTVHVHTIAGRKQLFDCPSADCDRVGEKGFTRKDNLLQHRRSIHRDDIPKRTVRFSRANARIRRPNRARAGRQGEAVEQE